MTWITTTQIPIPQPPPVVPTMADYMLAYAVHSALMNANMNFLSATPDAEYADPLSYRNALIVYAQSLLQNRFPIPYAPAGWNAISAGKAAAQNCFALLNQMPVNAGDPNTVSILMAWISGTGQLYGGHEPIPTGANSGVSAGQEAAPPNSIL